MCGTKGEYSLKRYIKDGRGICFCVSCELSVKRTQGINTDDVMEDLAGRMLGLGNINIEEISDDELFKDLPPIEECPICFLPMMMPLVIMTYMACCGKLLCEGCVMAAEAEMEDIGNGNIKRLCPFCRKKCVLQSDEQFVKRYKERMEVDDPCAYSSLGWAYFDGSFGLTPDINKTLELCNRAAELGSSTAHYDIANFYYYGEHVEKDLVKATHHYKLAAIGGHIGAHNNLGCDEKKAGNLRRAMKHYIIAAKNGHEKAMKQIGPGYRAGIVTKEEYTSTLRSYQRSRDEVKSEERTQASDRPRRFGVR